MRRYADSETNDRPALFFYVVCVRLFPADSYPWVYEAQPMLSMAVVPATKFEFFMSFAHTDGRNLRKRRNQ